jgi:hypothetical protein
VNPVSTSVGKFFSSSSVTAKAVYVGTSWFPLRSTYPRSITVPMIEAYVLGRPIPSASSVFTSDASV